jgi:hypothetical protein
MSNKRFSASPILAGLKDFQRRTVDYVFDSLYAKSSTARFLVADEVGLGKTMVARGLIARVLENLQDTIERIDIIYICSNAAIAAQNVNRLNVIGQKEFAIASRLTFLPMQVQELAQNKVNFISFTPGTTFDLKSRGGRAEERALIFKMLCGAEWDVGLGLCNMLQGAVQKKDTWRRRIEEWSTSIDETLADSFRTEVNGDKELVARLNACCEAFQRFRKHIPPFESEERYALLGELRYRLAQTCLHALQPDLVILDEFQRFKDLLDGEDDAALLARALFSFPDVRTLLLSATPYKMLSLDHEQDDDHYPDFIRTLRFLLKDEESVERLRSDIQTYRNRLFGLAEGMNTDITSARDQLQSLLLKVMCRTERVGMTQRLDAMLVEPSRPAPLEPADLDHAATVDRVARAVEAREPIEYWKSSPYLLNFLKGYDLRRRMDEVASAPPEELIKTLGESDGQVLKKAMFDAYQKIDPANARMRVLFSDTLDQGMWRLLWMPPSLPYTKPSGSYFGVDNVTKLLVFSAWHLVPNAIASICSYEAERRMIEKFERSMRHSELYGRIKPLLRFTTTWDDRFTGMPVIAWLLPSSVLASVIDPLDIAVKSGGDSPVSKDEMLAIAEARCKALVQKLPPGRQGNRVDERWYWAALSIIEKNTKVIPWCLDADGWMAAGAGHEPGSHFRDHVRHFVDAARGDMDLGPKPEDLPRVLAELALSSPGVCSLRSLQRAAPKLSPDDPQLLSAAARVAGGFRTLFNLPETIALLRGSGEESYWRLTLQYALDGNLQAVLDEQVHVLVEQLGLADHQAHERIESISEYLADSLSIRTAQIRIDEPRINGNAIELSSFNTRCRFALRFGDLRDDRDSTLARADTVREAFNSPFRPFILASTSIGQEGLDFHTWCHAVMHWNLPSNPVDLEQREGRVHRYKGHAVRKNIATNYGIKALRDWDGYGDPWTHLFDKAKKERPANSSDLVPFWVYEEGPARVERRVPMIPFSKETGQFERLKRSLALYRLVFGQPRQEDLLAHIAESIDIDVSEKIAESWRIILQPPANEG